MQSFVGYLLIAAQFGLSACLVLSARLTPICYGCLAIAATGAALAIWAWVVMGLRRLSLLPQVRRDARLVTSPPYRWIRHPMYTGLLLFCAGLIATNYSPGKGALWLLLLAALVVKARLEEHLVAERFPEYSQYKLHTWRFVPFLY